MDVRQSAATGGAHGELQGLRRRSLLLFQNKIAADRGVGAAEPGGDAFAEDFDLDDPDGDGSDPNRIGGGGGGKSRASTADGSVADVPSDPTHVTTSDLLYFLFDGFPTAAITGYFPHWYEASLWAERINTLFVLLSIVAIATETLPEFYIANEPIFFYVEIACISYFTFEFAIRLVCCRSFVSFCKKLLNWVDLISILPFYIGLLIQNDDQATGGLVLLRFFRLLRILRVLKLSRRNVGLLAVFEALYESSEAIALLGFLVVIALMVFSTLMFYAEQLNARFDQTTDQWMREDDTISPFQSIFHSMWWCIVTMTTVGYGDDVPVTVTGKLVGGATMIAGVFVLAFPTVILSTNFQEIHQAKVEGHRQMERIFAAQREAARRRAEERRKREEELERRREQNLLLEERDEEEEEEMEQEEREMDSQEVDEIPALVPHHHQHPPPPHDAVAALEEGRAEGGGDRGPSQLAAARSPEPSPQQDGAVVVAIHRPKIFPFVFRPYTGHPPGGAGGGGGTTPPLASSGLLMTQPQSPPLLSLAGDTVVSMAMGLLDREEVSQATFSPRLGALTQDRVQSTVIARDIHIVDDLVAVYNPVLHLRCNDKGELAVRVEQFLSKTVVTIDLLLESAACQMAAEAAVRERRPDLKVPVLPRPISKLKVDIVCSHPLLTDVRLQSGSFVEPAGIVALSLLVPYPSLVRVLLANLSTLTVVTWIAFDSPGALEEPLIHYGGVVLGETDFDDEELDEHGRQLLADPQSFQPQSSNNNNNAPLERGSSFASPDNPLSRRSMQGGGVGSAFNLSALATAAAAGSSNNNNNNNNHTTSLNAKRVRLLELPPHHSAGAEVSDEEQLSADHNRSHHHHNNNSGGPASSTISPTGGMSGQAGGGGSRFGAILSGRLGGGGGRAAAVSLHHTTNNSGSTASDGTAAYPSSEGGGGGGSYPLARNETVSFNMGPNELRPLSDD